MICPINVVYRLDDKFKVSVDRAFQVAVVDLMEPQKVDEFVV